MKFFKKAAALAAAVSMLCSLIPSWTASASEVTQITHSTISFDSLAEGELTETALSDIKEDWQRVAPFNGDSEVVSGVLGKEADDRSVKFTSNGAEQLLCLYPTAAYSTISSDVRIHLSFDMAVSGYDKQQQVIFRGNGNSDAVNLIGNRGDGIEIGGKVIKDTKYRLSADGWHNYDFLIYPGGTSRLTYVVAAVDGNVISKHYISKLRSGIFNWLYFRQCQAVGDYMYIDNVDFTIDDDNKVEPYVLNDYSVDFDSLDTGDISNTNIQAVKDGWKSIALDYAKTETGYSVVDGVFGKNTGDKALKLRSTTDIKDAQYVQFFPEATATSISSNSVIEISFDIAVSDNTTARYVMYRGNGNSDALALFQTRGDGFAVCGSIIRDYGPLQANTWYNFKFEIQPGIDDNNKTKANVWMNNRLIFKSENISRLDNGVFNWFYLYNDAGHANAVDGEETYFDNFKYTVTNWATISSPEFTYDPENLYSTDFSNPPEENKFPNGFGGGAPGSTGLEPETVSYVTGIGGRTSDDYSMKVATDGSGTSTNYAPWFNIQPSNLLTTSKNREIGAGVSLLINDSNNQGRFRMHFIDSAGTWFEAVTVSGGGTVAVNNNKTVVDKKVKQGEWIRLDVKYNPSSNAYSVWLNGEKICENVQTTLANNINRYRMDYYIGSPTKYSEFYLDDVDLYTLDYKTAADASKIAVTSADSTKTTVNDDEILLHDTMTVSELLAGGVNTDSTSTKKVYTDASCTSEVSESSMIADGNVLVVSGDGLYSYHALYNKGKGYTLNSFTAKVNDEASESEFTVGTVTVEAEFTTYTSDMPVDVWVAQYTDDGQLIGLALGNTVNIDGTLDEFKGSKATVSSSLSIDSDENTYVKAMLWDKETLIPLAAAIKLVPASKTNITTLKKRYPGFTNKAATFSFDDGRSEDAQLIEVFNEYGVHGTFNLVSDQNILKDADDAQKAYVKELYKGQEIANHVKSHPHMDSTGSAGPMEVYVADSTTFIQKINEGKAELEEIFGEGTVKGYAWPYNDPTTYLSNPGKEAQAVSDYVTSSEDIVYARRTETTGDFDVPENFHEWKFTKHYSALPSIGDKFFADTSDELRLMSLWGHSYEFSGNAKVTLISDFLAKATESNIWIPTNIEYVNYINAMNSAVVGENSITNNSDIDLYFIVNYKPIKVEAGSTFYLYEQEMSTKPTVFLAGDSTCEDYPADDRPSEEITGWGTKFVDKVSFNVDNRAKRNESTKTFKTKFAQIIEDGKKGDYVFIQFGHNDSMTARPERYCTESEYKENLTEYVTAAREKGMIPVFLTSTRGIAAFTDYTLPDDGVDVYRNAMTALGKELNVVTLNVSEKHREFLKTLTLSEAQEYYCTGDTTHFNEKGAEMFASIVAGAIKGSNALGLSYYVK